MLGILFDLSKSLFWEKIMSSWFLKLIIISILNFLKKGNGEELIKLEKV